VLFDYFLYPPILGVIGLLIAFVIYHMLIRHNHGDGEVKHIGDQIHLGAMVFMQREYKMLAMFAAVLLLGIFVSPLGTNTAIAFTPGAVSSALAGFLGMFAATKANVRTAVAAHNHGQAFALSIAFYGGSIMGLCVASLGLIGLGSLYYYFGGDPDTAHAIHGFGMGASVVALFSRVGGGIFTKSADVGADLVGKVEAGIPEDDPRNPGVIADNVGDNVGDIAGMGSDIFESYCGSMIACIAIASTMSIDHQAEMMFLPLALASIGLLASVLGIVVVRMRSDAAPEAALRTGTLLAPALFAATGLVPGAVLRHRCECLVVVTAGAVGGVLIGLVTEYYTGAGPVEKIAQSGETGPATVMITGLAVGMQSVVLPILFLARSSGYRRHWRASTASASPPSACWRRSVSPWPSTPTAPWRITPAVSPRWRAWARRRAASPTDSTRSATPRRRSARASRSAPRRWRPWPSSPPSSRPCRYITRGSPWSSRIRPYSWACSSAARSRS
jgi:K(+)-stimulated pyrophosphate-energized sodium pump